MAVIEAVRRVLAGDLDAFAELEDYCDYDVRACLYSIVKNQEEVRDLEVEVMEDIFKKLPQYDPRRDFLVWARGFARRRGLEKLRERKYRPKFACFDLVPEELLPAWPGPDEEHEQMLAEDRALDLVAPLPEHQQESVMLCVGLGMTAEAAAKLTGRNVKTVESDVHRGLSALRRRAEEDETTGGKRRHDGA